MYVKQQHSFIYDDDSLAFLSKLIAYVKCIWNLKNLKGHITISNIWVKIKVLFAATFANEPFPLLGNKMHKMYENCSC